MRVATSRYGIRELVEDAEGYGDVLYAATGERVDHVGPRGATVLARLDAREQPAFLGRMHALVETTREIRLYRWYDESPRRRGAPLVPVAAARAGGWWTPRRPSAEIDRVFLASLHKNARSDAALLRSWNKMHSLVEATLGRCARVFVGRIAPQFDETKGELLTGGFIQFLIPLSNRHHLKRFLDHHWVP